MILLDKFGRQLSTVRISVIDQCNLRCTYCMPKEVFGPDFPFLPPSKLLTFDEIKRLVTIFAALGVKKVRLTGGEPLLRKGLPELVERLLHVKGIEDISITTNGVLLGTYAERLVNAGLKRINVSLDSLNSYTYGQMNGRNFPVEKVLHSINEAATKGLQIKINMVVQKGVNDQDILKMAKYCYDNDYTLRFIEYMDVGNTNKWEMSQVFPNDQILEILKKHFDLIPVADVEAGDVAKRFIYKGTKKEVGFISSVTSPFCGECNRVRVSAEGKLYTCLFATSGFDLRNIIQNGSDDDVKKAIISIWKKRQDRYSEERKKGRNIGNKIEMSYIGG